MFIRNTFILQGRFFPSFQFLCSIQRNPSCIISKLLGRKDFSMEQLPIDSYIRSSRPEVFLKKGVLKICSKLTGEHPCRSAVSVKFQCKFIEIMLRHGCSPVNLLHIFRTPFYKNTSGWLLLLMLPIVLRGMHLSLTNWGRFRRKCTVDSTSRPQLHNRLIVS